MLAGRTGEIVSRRETPSQCGRVGSPGLIQLNSGVMPLSDEPTATMPIGAAIIFWEQLSFSRLL